MIKLFNHLKLFSNQLIIKSSNNYSKKIYSKKMSDSNKNSLVWVDLEMSGLNIDKEHILEMACLITDQDLNVIAEGPELIIHQSDQVLADMDAWCTKTHRESGLTQAVRESKINIAQAEEMMLTFLRQNNIPKGQCPLAGNSVHADRMFLNKYMKNFLNHLHYRIVDVSTIKELTKRWYPNEPGFAKKNAHRALDDIKESIAELKYYRYRVFKDI